MSGEPCAHRERAFLGEDAGRNRYYRCRECEAVLVSDGVTTWAVREAPEDLER